MFRIIVEKFVHDNQYISISLIAVFWLGISVFQNMIKKDNAQKAEAYKGWIFKSLTLINTKKRSLETFYNL
jgi:hypothetical protein